MAGHEPDHFIKSAYSLITKGIISRDTSNKGQTLESGFLLEEILFVWVVDKDNPLDTTKLGLIEKIECKNDAIKNKKIDMITALQLLNPEIYNKDLTYFRKSIFGVTKNNLKSFSFSSIKNNEYRTFLQSIIEEKVIKNLYNDDDQHSINAAMRMAYNIGVGYIRFNHNKEKCYYNL